jgi:hypothetical protein
MFQRPNKIKKMKTKMMMLIIAIVFAMINFQAGAQEKFSLSYKMEKGKTYRFKQDNKIESTQEMGGQEMKMIADENSTIIYDVLDVSPEGLMSIIYKYENTKLKMKGMGRDTTMDLKNMQGKKIHAELAKNGRVTKETKADTTKEAKSSPSLNMFANASLPRLPEQSVGIGEKWSGITSDTTHSDEGMVVYKKNIEYTLSGKEQKGTHDCLKINFKGTLEMNGTMKQMGMDIAMEGTGETSGSFWFDAVSGLLIEDGTITTIEETLALTGQQQMTIPMSQRVTSSKTLSE